MQTSSLIKKIRTYLGVIAPHMTTLIEKIDDIGIFDCPYKESNELPKKSLFRKYDTSVEWGTGKDSHAWFRFETSAKPELLGKPLILRVHSAVKGWDADNPQFIVYVDGKCGRDLMLTIPMFSSTRLNPMLFTSTHTLAPNLNVPDSLRNFTNLTRR